jgi:hypothetical protein
MHGNAGWGVFSGIVHIAVTGGFFYLIYHIAKSLRRIADYLDANHLNK